MQVEIKLRGPAGCGKTWLADRLAEVLQDAPTGTHVVIESTNHPRPDGIDTTPTHAWNREHEFDVGA